MAKSALVVDDSFSMRQMVGAVLRQQGFAVTESANGKEALDKLAASRFNVVITDLNMPVMDGITFIKGLRARADCKFTPVLMLTTESAQDQKALGKAAGATGWLVKPFNPDQLIGVLNRLLP